MTTIPEFLTLDDVLSIHEHQLREHGGCEGLRDRPGLESAIAMPQASFDGTFLHSDLFEMATAYVFHISQSQAFVDGNKRVGLVAGLLFLEINDCPVWDPNGVLYQAIIDIAERRLDKKGMAAVLRSLPRDLTD